MPDVVNMYKRYINVYDRSCESGGHEVHAACQVLSSEAAVVTGLDGHVREVK